MARPKKRWLEYGWRTYGDAHAYFRGIVNNALQAGFKPGQPLPPDYETPLRWLLAGDPTFSADDWPHIGYFTLHRPYDFDKSKIGFAVALVRLLSDGTSPLHHFSVRICLGQIPRKTNVSNAFKAEIEPELEAAQKHFLVLGGCCIETAEPLDETNLALDYIGPGFKQILERFLLQEGREMRSIELDDDGIVDRGLATRWYAYFVTTARLVGVSKRGLKRRNERRKSDPFWGMTT